MRIKFFSILFTIFFLVIVVISFAQPGPPVGGPNPCPPQNPNCDPGIPIVQFIPLLVSLGLWLGTKSFFKKKKN